MLGNWATGRLTIQTTPISTMTMAMTIATMGRLMKNRYMPSLLRLLGCKRLGVDRQALLGLLRSLDDHALAGLKPFFDNPIGADALPHLDRPNVDFVLAVHNRQLVTALQL